MASRFATATVAATGPLRLLFDGDDPSVTVPALTVSSYTPVVDDRVRVELRTPLLPLVLGAVT